jgi:hypothetical protein
MKLSIITAALALSLVGAHTAAMAQDNETQVFIGIGSDEPSPESPAAARKEAAAALAQARKDCRKEPGRDEQKSCLDAAREDHDKLMAEANSQAKSDPR